MPMLRAPLNCETACETMLTGLVKLTSQADGRQPGHEPAVFEHRRDGANGHREAGRAHRFLADNAVRDAGGLVGRALRESRLRGCS